MSNNSNGRRVIRREPEPGMLVQAAIAGIDAIIDEAFKGLRESWCQSLAAGENGKDAARFFHSSMARSEEAASRKR